MFNSYIRKRHDDYKSDAYEWMVNKLITDVLTNPKAIEKSAGQLIKLVENPRIK